MLTANPDYILPSKITRIVALGERVRCCLPLSLVDPLPPHVTQTSHYKSETMLAHMRTASGGDKSNIGMTEYSSALTPLPTMISELDQNIATPRYSKDFTPLLPETGENASHGSDARSRK